MIPIAILLGSIGGYSISWANGTGSTSTLAAGGTGLLFIPPLLMIVFRQKYPRWWFDWNLHLRRFANRVGVYLALMDARYPSTDEHQSVRLDFAYPDASEGVNRWLPLVKCCSRSPTTSCCSSSTSARFLRSSEPGYPFC